MKTDEVVTMCNRLSKKYRRPDIAEDLVSEAVVAVYERLAVEPEDYPASLYRVANKAMHDYINIKSKPVSIPRSNSARGLSKGDNYEGGSYSQEGKKALEEALNSVSVPSEESYTLSSQDCTVDYETKDFIDKAMGVLNDKEKEIINQLYFLEMSQSKVSQLQGVTQQTISNWESEAIVKMSSL